MPIYAYKCASCGHAKDVLQKISDAPLTVCPVCGAESFTKQVTAAGFHLKGTGWYATDFRGGTSSAPAAEKSESAAPADVKSGESKPVESKPADSKPADSKAAPKTEPAKPSQGSSGKADAPAASASGTRGRPASC